MGDDPLSSLGVPVSATSDPLANLGSPVNSAPPSATQQPTDPVADLAKPMAAPPAPPEGYGLHYLKSVIDQTKQQWTQTQAWRDQEAQVAKTVGEAVKKGDFGTAAEVLIPHLMRGAGSVAKSVINNAVANATELDPNHGQMYANPIAPMPGVSGALEDFATDPASRAEAAAPAASPKATGDNPIESKTTDVTSKAKLPQGKSATSEVDVKQDIAKQNMDAETGRTEEGKQIQGNLQNGIRDYWTKVAKDNGVEAPDPKSSIRDVGQKVGDNIIEQAKKIIKPLDDATDGKFSENDLALKDVNSKLRRVTSIDDEDKLISEKQRLLRAQDGLLNDAKKAGVPDNTLETFRKKYRAGQAIYDQNHHIRMTTSGLPPGVSGAESDPEIIKSGNLLNRLTKDYSPEEGGKNGRLIQAGGEENAHSLLNSVSTAKVAENNLASSVIKDNPEFSTLPATESNALREIVRKHVSAGKMFGTNTDYKGILDEFDKMGPSELKARFSNPSAVRQSIVKAQAVQTAIKVLGGTGAAAGAGAAGKIGWDLAQ
jgi:hypothetical protein